MIGDLFSDVVFADENWNSLMDLESIPKMLDLYKPKCYISAFQYHHEFCIDEM